MMTTHPLFRLLDPFYRPGDGRIRACELLEPGSGEWLTDQWIGVGLRGRAAMEVDCMKMAIFKTAKSITPSPQVLVLASGSGRHPLVAFRMAQEQIKTKPHITFVDIDPRATIFTRVLARDSGISSSVITMNRDILHVKGFGSEHASSVAARSLKAKKLQPISTCRFGVNSVDVVSVIGLLEYLPMDFWNYHSGFLIGGREIILKKRGVAALLAEAWSILRPGGFLMFDIANTESPFRITGHGNYQVDFCVNVLKWNPMRTFSPFGTVLPGMTDSAPLVYIAEAGLDPESIEIHREPSGFFDLYVLRKAY